MNNPKNTIYIIVFLIFILLALAGWFVTRGQSNTSLIPSMPHDADGTFSPVEEKPQAPDTNTTPPITILAPVPEGVGHDTSGWKKITGKVPVVLQAGDAVSKVIFYLDRTVVGEVTGPPFDFELDTTKYTDCMYILRAKAYDSKGNELGEDRSQIWIDNTPTNCM